VRSKSRIHPRGGCLANVLILLAVVCLVGSLVGFFAARSGVEELTALVQRFRDGSIPVQTVVTPGTTTMTIKSEGVLGLVVIGDDEVNGTRYPLAGRAGVDVKIMAPDGSQVAFESFQDQPNGMVIQGESEKIEVLGIAPIEKAGDYSIAVGREGDPIAVRVGALETQAMESLVKSGAKTLFGGFGVLCGGAGFVIFGLIGGILWLFGRKKPA
jgi:hypothetical protein